MSSRALEVERKYDVPEGLPLPDLRGLTPRTGRLERHELVAVYHDTQDLRLRRGRVTLRHRTGGPDAGWHLKRPRDGDREELRVEGALEDGVPQELVLQVRALTRGAPLVPVAELRTERTVRPLRDSTGTRLVEVVDDVVEGRRPGGDVLRWREGEVELVGGERRLLDRVEKLLLRAGAARAAGPSKAARVLPLQADPVPWLRAGKRTTAGSVLQEHLREQVDRLVARDPGVRDGDPDAVHRARVACRRLRSALRTARPLLDRSRTDPLRDELRWFAGELGPVRDLEVVHRRLRARLRREPAELVLGPVAALLDTALTADAVAAHERAVRALDDDRWVRLLDALDALVADPPLSPRADRPAEQELVRLVRRQVRRWQSEAAAADDVPSLHGVRKRAKAVRYASELAEVVCGQEARRLQRRARAVQDELGALQDAAVAQDVLRRLAVLTAAEDRNGFTFGRLHALEQVRAERAVARWAERDPGDLVPAKALRWLR